jgi:signal transduction histidine kinase
LNKHKKGEHKGIRYILNIDNNDNAKLVKIFLDLGMQIRHIKNMPPMSFGVSDKEMAATMEKMEDGKMVQNLLVSNEPTYIKHFTYIFEELWKNGIYATDRIREIEEGIEPEFFEVITDPNKSSQILLDLAKSVKEEALLLLPNDKVMVRTERLGVIDYVIKASQENGATIKIICPLSEENSKIIKRISEQAADIRILNGNNSQTGMFIADSTKFLRAELKEPKAEEFSEAIGFTVYSNSRRSIDSFKSVFELLWNERSLNEELKRADIMQKEFINVAAHELRTPIQPIIGLSDVLHSKIKDTEQRELLDVVIRNAKRLHRLTEDILDVARIESESLILRKSRFNLKELILNTITDYKSQIKKEVKDNKVELGFTTNEDNDNDIFVYGDTGRITQVISNLLSNAIKFTEEGTITVKIQKRIYNNNQGVVIVSIKDTGKGIDPTIREKLFEKFATRSEKGMGLGLYLSRKIIEAHDGNIWAENNVDSKGATFSFSLQMHELSN